MNKKLIKLTIIAVASAFAVAPFALADDEAGDKGKKREGGERRGSRGGPGGPGGFDREAFIKEFDQDKDGKLDEDERKAAGKKMMERRKERADEMFKKADTNNSGTLNLEEFTAIREGADPERAAGFFKKADADADGELTKEEMAKARPTRGPRGGDGPGGRPPRGEDGGKGKGKGKGKGEGKKRPPVEE